MLRVSRERGDRATGHAPLKKVESQRVTPLAQLADLDITRMQSHRWQQIAAVPEPKCIRKGSHTDGIEAYARAVGREAEWQTVRLEYHAAEVAKVCTRVQTSSLLKLHRHLAEIHAAPPEALPLFEK